MNREFTTYEQALALKELGFDEESFGHYRTYGKNLFYATPIARNLPARYRVINAPLYQQAFRWFRETHNVFAYIDVNHCYIIYINDEFNQTSNIHHSYEEAEQACLDKLIKICKIKKQ